MERELDAGDDWVLFGTVIGRVTSAVGMSTAQPSSPVPVGTDIVAGCGQVTVVELVPCSLGFGSADFRCRVVRIYLTAGRLQVSVLLAAAEELEELLVAVRDSRIQHRVAWVPVASGGDCCHFAEHPSPDS